eukprot:Phypoly_transcript_15550.p1 GENE.Phypoly_transcript_15550~~Phypoly_transcript_15550.p1  ORF type:complete len:271 (+),score=35.41 Phypoly_transcript_15550:51-863(+)
MATITRGHSSPSRPPSSTSPSIKKPASSAKPAAKVSAKPAPSKPVPSSKAAPKPAPSKHAPSPPAADDPFGSEKSFVRKQELSGQKFDKNKAADPFASKRLKSNFAVVYTNGGIPCRINHGGVKHSLQWDRPPCDLSFDPLLVTCAEGLIEKEHPYVFISRLAFKELIESEGGAEKVLPLVGRIIPHIRTALRSEDSDTFLAALAALEQLSNAVGPELNPHLSSLLAPMNQKMRDKKLAPAVTNTLHLTASNGGPLAANTIKSKIPTFNA